MADWGREKAAERYAGGGRISKAISALMKEQKAATTAPRVVHTPLGRMVGESEMFEAIPRGGGAATKKNHTMGR